MSLSFKSTEGAVFNYYPNKITVPEYFEKMWEDKSMHKVLERLYDCVHIRKSLCTQDAISDYFGARQTQISRIENYPLKCSRNYLIRYICCVTLMEHRKSKEQMSEEQPPIEENEPGMDLEREPENGME